MRKAKPFEHKGWDGVVRKIENVSEPCPCWKTRGQQELPAGDVIDQARRAAGEKEEA